jgi:two-component system, cell cycle sensor histidine kinase and response regulator CckA
MSDSGGSEPTMATEARLTDPMRRLPDPFRALLVEDCEDDAILILRELQRGGGEVIHKRVETQEDMLSALEEGPWDVVLSDYTMPRFDGLSALGVARAHDPDMPFIVISGTIGEEVAVSTMRAGASDYLLKGRLTRLVPAIERELREAGERRARKRAEQERDRLFNLSVDMFCVSGFDGYFKQINPAWRATLGWDREELLSRPWRDFVHPEDDEKTAAVAKCLLEGKVVYAFENRFRCKDGSYRWISWNSFPLPAEGLIVAVARDVTDRKGLEAQLIQAQKMEAVGRLAGGVAHDFNNLLTPILGYADLLLSRPVDSETEQGGLEQIKRAAERARDLTRQLLAFGRKQVLEMRVLDLNEVIASARKMLRRLVREDIEIDLQCQANPAMVRADRAQVEQILMNLLINAADAMPKGGKISIRTFTAPSGDAPPAVATSPEGRDYVVLRVTDTGSGMDSETLSMVFEPFFTTKPQGQGTGLGLSMVHGIVRQHEGAITVESQPGKGTTFLVYLPRVEAAKSEEPEPAAPDTKMTGDEVILVVEDDRSVRRLTCAVLAARGYQVIEAQSVDEALRQVSDLDKPIDLLLTDVVMPKMNGRELHERLAALTPGIRALYMSGYSREAVAHHGVLGPGVHFIQKPFSVQRLTEKVREALKT